MTAVCRTPFYIVLIKAVVVIFRPIMGYIHIHTYFISNTAVTRKTLCWEDGKATTALTAALKKKKTIKKE